MTSLPASAATPARLRLGSMLLSSGVIDEAQLGKALQEQKKTGRKLGRVLTEMGFADEDQVAQAMADQLGLVFVDLKTFAPQPPLVQMLTEGQARRFRAMVLSDEGDRLQLGMADPSDLGSSDEVSRLLRREIEVRVIAESQLLLTIDRLYRRTDQINTLARELTSEIGSVPADFNDLLGLTSPGSDDAPVVRLLYTVFDEALRTHASDVHIEPQENNLRIRFRIDGQLHVQMVADSKIAVALALRLKLMSGLDISEKRLPQDGRFALRVRENAVDVRISTMPVQYGESVVMRLLTQGALLSLDNAGMPHDVRSALERAMRRTSGMVLVTGPTGSGKTTTLYAALAAINDVSRKVLTVEDPVEYRLPGLNQVQINERIDLTFEKVLRGALRQDPDVLLVGEMRDQMTAEIGMRAAMTGHLVLSTLHTNDALSTPLRLLDMGVPRYMVAMAIQLVIAQRLVRRVCDRCAQPVQCDAAQTAWIDQALADGPIEGLGDRPRLRRGTGCGHCNLTGFSGRLGVFEYIEMSQGLIAALNGNDDSAFARVGREQIAGRTFGRDALRLAFLGETTIEEAMRVSNELTD